MLQPLLARIFMVACIIALIAFGAQSDHKSTGLAMASSTDHMISLYSRAEATNPTAANNQTTNNGSSNQNSTIKDNGQKTNKTSSNSTDVNSDENGPSIIKMVKPILAGSTQTAGAIQIGQPIYFEWQYNEDTLKIKPKNVTLEVCRNNKDYFILQTFGYQNPTQYTWDTSKWDVNAAGWPLSSATYQIYVYDERGRNNITDSAGRLSTYMGNIKLYIPGISCADCSSASSLSFSKFSIYGITALASVLVYLVM
ncbi:hypothetical protein BDF19DRAFT_433056 [Syncephalis fuscata]|nr:hypothetical protein BDF19DRAFT_433056 [Syncephalis fuscata]